MNIFKKTFSSDFVTGGIDTITPSRISGWVLSGNFQFDEVKLYIGKDLIEKTKIDIERQDVSEKFSLQGNHGFNLFIPSTFKYKKIYLLSRIKIYATCKNSNKKFNLKLFKDKKNTNKILKAFIKSKLFLKDGFIDGIKYDGKIYGWAGLRNSTKSTSIWMKDQNSPPLEIKCDKWRSGLEFFKVGEFSGFCLDPTDEIYRPFIGKEIKFYFDPNCKYIIPQSSTIIFPNNIDKKNLNLKKKIKISGFFDGFSDDYNLILGWAFSNHVENNIWLISEKNNKLKIECSKYRFDRDSMGEYPYTGFEINIDSLNSCFSEEDNLYKLSFDKNGKNLLPGFRQPFFLPEKINSADRLKEIFQYHFNDFIEEELRSKIDKLNLYGGFYKNWFSRKYLKKEPISFETELFILNRGKNFVYLNPFSKINEDNFLSGKELVIPKLHECSEECFKKNIDKLHSSSKTLIPEDFPPKFRQSLINNATKSISSISVIIPSWNREKTLLRAIDSALNQTLKPKEVIVCDDGSDDESLKRMHECFPFAISNKILKIIESDHLGVSNARNMALKISKGEFLAYLDSDNTWHPDHLLFLYNFLSNNGNEFDLVYSTRRLYGSRINGKILPVKPFDYRKLLIENFIDLNCVIHNRKLYENEGGFDIRLKRLVDWELMLRYTSSTKIKTRVSHINLATVNYWRNKDFLSNISVNENWEDPFKIINKRYKK